MAINHANSFVEKFFEDNEFTRIVLRKRGFSKNEINKENEETGKMIKVANELGFKFNEEEYIESIKNYMNNLSGWEAAKKVFRIVNIASNVFQENQY